MSFSTALQLLRLPAARSVASSQFRRSSSSASKPNACRSNQSQQRSQNASHRPHAPHGDVDQGVAGPSRCFCTSHRRHKASELPLEELHYQSSLDTYRHDQLPTTSDFWQRHDASRTLTPARRQPSATQQHDIEPAPSIRAFFPDNQHLPVDSSSNDFFTPSVQQRNGPASAAIEPSPTAHRDSHAFVAPTPYIDSLEPQRREALDDRIRLLLRSGEHSMPALCAEYGDCTPLQQEQICCHILSQCVRDSQDASVVWDLYRTWPTVLHTEIAPAGPLRSTLRRMQGDTLYRCTTYLHDAGLTRQAATMLGDVRLKASQSRYLLEQLMHGLKLPPLPPIAKGNDVKLEQVSTPPTVSFAAADARIAVREMCDAMTSLMADGVSFKRKVVNRMLKLLCLIRARSRVVRLLRAAQRRAQIELDCGSQLRAAGGFSRLRAEAVKPPQVVSTKVVEEAIRVLCAQDSTGARTAYELLCALDMSQRTPAMYNALVTRYGCSATDLHSSGGYRTVDEQLWYDICTHMGGPTVHTMSARIVCHARRRRLDLIKSDLAFQRTANLGTIHQLTEHAQLSIVRCAIETGSLLVGFRYASSLIAASSPAFHRTLIATLLRAASHIRLPCATSSPSRAQLLKRFLRHFSHLHAKHAQLQPDVLQLSLVIELLDRHEIESQTLWSMLRLVGRHFGKEDRRLVGVLMVFVKVFEGRGESESVKELRSLIDKLQHAA